MKKNVSLSMVGRRDKQQILKDFIRPPPASTISSSISSPISGYDGGNIPGCAGGPSGREPCGEAALPMLANWGGNSMGYWVRYPQPPIPPITTDLTRFTNHYQTGSFPFMESIADGPVLDYWGVAGSGSLLNTQLWSYRAAVDGSGQLYFFGGAFASGSIGLVGLNDSLYENLPFEVLVRFRVIRTPEFGEEADQGSAVTLNLADRSEEDIIASGAVTGINQGISINFGRQFVADNLTVFMSGSSNNISIASIPECGGGGIIEGGEYKVRAKMDEFGISAKLWLTSFPEPPAWQISRVRVTAPLLSGFNAGIGSSLLLANCDSGISLAVPCLDFPDLTASIFVEAVFINPSAVGDGPCDEQGVDETPGVYLDTLVKKSAYWVPASLNVTEYRQVYFDQIPVYEDTHYWLDGLKLYPNDPGIFDDTLATALLVAG